MSPSLMIYGISMRLGITLWYYGENDILAVRVPVGKSIEIKRESGGLIRDLESTAPSVE